MLRLQTGSDWLDNLRLRPMPRETHHLTVTVNGEERNGTWKEGVGIYVDGFDIDRGDTVLVQGTPYEVVEMWRMQMEGEAVTLLLKAKPGDGQTGLQMQRKLYTHPWR